MRDAARSVYKIILKSGRFNSANEDELYLSGVADRKMYVQSFGVRHVAHRPLSRSINRMTFDQITIH